MSTGPADTETLVVVPTEATGPTGPADTETLVVVPTEATGPTGPALPPMVIDIAELLASQGAVKVQEDADRATLLPLLNETRELLRPQLFAWAAAGFPGIYVIQEFSVTPPAICSDGVSRGVYDYVVYLLGQEMGPIIAAIQALCIGVQISYSFAGNTLRIHVSRH